MTELGHPFFVKYEDVIEALKERILNGVEQPANDRFTYSGPGTSYELRRLADAVTGVTGLSGGKFHEFEPATDYRFAGNRIVWLDHSATPDRPASVNPDRNSRFQVDYTYREHPPGLTDFNPGSVVGTLVHAVARQMKSIYDQMEEAYRRAFIDEATGVALDNVVALLGVTRNQALSSEGYVTFYRRTETKTSVVVPGGTRVADEGGRTFRTTAEGTIPPEIDEHTGQSDGILRVERRIAKLVDVWEGDTDAAPKISPKPTVSDEDERALVLADTVRPEGQLLIRYHPKSVTVPVEAVEPGPDGNVNAGAIVLMPTPARGIDGVVNEESVRGGTPAEADDQLRERAKHELERSGNATLNAIRFAVLDVEGVEGVEVIDHSVDGTVPLGEVRVRYSGGEGTDVMRAIEDTRAAGVLALADEIRKVLVSGTFYLIPGPEPLSSSAAEFLSAALEAMKEPAIGAPLSVRRLISLAYGIPGLDDVAEAQLNHDRDDDGDSEISDPFLVERTELVRPAEDNLEAVLVTALEASSGSSGIEVQLLDYGGNPVRWRNFSLDVSVTLGARRKVAPEQQPERVGSFQRKLVFSDAATTTLSITAADTPDFREEDHEHEGVEVAIGAAAYPGILGAETTIDLPDEE